MNDLEVFGPADGPAIGFEFTRNNFEQGALAAAVGADHTETLAGLQDEVEAAQQLATAERLVDPGGDQQPLGAAARAGHFDAGLGGRQFRLDLGEISHQAFGLVNPSLGLGGPRLGSATQPLEFAPHPVGEAVAVLGPRLEVLCAPFQKG